jgi:hypothetical protein
MLRSAANGRQVDETGSTYQSDKRHEAISVNVAQPTIASDNALPHVAGHVQGAVMLRPWLSDAELALVAPLPEGYRYERLSRARVPELIAFLRACYPGIEVGNASCHLREDFYLSKVSLQGEPDRDFVVMLFMHGDDLVGMHSTERDMDSEILYGRIGAIAPARRRAGRRDGEAGRLRHDRGRGLAIAFLAMMEAMGGQWVPAWFTGSRL